MRKILIVDDHPIVRQGLKRIIARTPDQVIVDEACDGHEALKKIRETSYSVVLLDITLPGLHGLDVLKQLKSEQPKLSILILTIHAEERYAARALIAGASGYLTKKSAPDELMRAIQKVSSGGKYISPSLAEKLASILGTISENPPHEALSDREYQVFCLIAQGNAIKDIAVEMSLSVKTVSTYRSRVLRKMEMKGRAEVIRYGMQYHLVD